jgi:hypothetical protein
MSIEIEEPVEAEAIGRSTVGPDDKPAEPGQALAVIESSEIVLPAAVSAIQLPG